MMAAARMRMREALEDFGAAIWGVVELIEGADGIGAAPLDAAAALVLAAEGTARAAAGWFAGRAWRWREALSSSAGRTAGAAGIGVAF